MVVFLPEVPGWEVSSWTGSTHSLVAPKKKDFISKGEVILSITITAQTFLFYVKRLGYMSRYLLSF